MSEQGSKMQVPWREVLAYDIHDGPCQYLVSAKMYFDIFHHLAGEKAAGDWVAFESGMTALNQALDELRRFIGGLRPAHHEGADLRTAIQRLVAEVQASGGPEIEFCHDFHDYDLDPLPSHLALAAFHIVRECVTNACRHSKSKRMLVGLSRDSNSLCVQVQDWGIGFDPAKTADGCFGLEGVCRRADLLGGTATIQSRPGEGTCIAVELPLVASAKEPSGEGNRGIGRTRTHRSLKA